MYTFDGWQYTKIDDELPVRLDKNGHPDRLAFARHEGADEFAGSLLEKAMAKQSPQRSYRWVDELLSDRLSFAHNARVSLNGGWAHTVNVPRAYAKRWTARFFAWLVSAYCAGSLLTFGTITISSTSSSTDSSSSRVSGFTPEGLLTNHAFSLVGISEVEGRRLLLLNNPHGETGFKGRWSKE